jgi:hypothetical protein
MFIVSTQKLSINPFPEKIITSRTSKNNENFASGDPKHGFDMRVRD